METMKEILYEDENGNKITNFKISNSSKICICKSNNKMIETYQFTLQIDGNEDIIVLLNRDELIKYMKKSGCIWLPEANINYFTVERKVKEICSESKTETFVLFEKPGWNFYKNEWYYVCTDCSISAKGIDTHKTTIIRNRNFNYIKDTEINKKENFSNIVHLILDNKKLFYPAIVTTIISLMLDKLNDCNLTQTPIIWLSGETGAGKTTILMDTFFILENDSGKINFNLSTQSKKETKENIENNSDCIIAYDDVRKTYSNSSNQRISTTLEEFVRQYSEIIDTRIVFAVTGEANVLAQQGESFQNRCMEFEVNNIVADYKKVLDNVKQKKLMKVLWEQLIIWIAKMRNEKTFPNLEKIYGNWIGNHKIKSNNARGIQIAFAEYASGYVFNKFMKDTLSINKQEEKEWRNFIATNIESGILYREATHYLSVETFKKYLYKFLLEKKLMIVKPKYNYNTYSGEKKVVNITLPIYNKEHYIGIYFKYGISNCSRQTEGRSFLLLDIAHTLQTMNYFLNCKYNNNLDYFNEKKLYKRLAEKKVLYVCQKSSSPDGFRYAFEYPAYVQKDRQDLRRCWMLAVDEELDNILKDVEEIKRRDNIDDKYINIIKNFLNDPANEEIKNLNNEEHTNEEYRNYESEDDVYKSNYDESKYEEANEIMVNGNFMEEFQKRIDTMRHESKDDESEDDGSNYNNSNNRHRNHFSVKKLFENEK